MIVRDPIHGDIEFTKNEQQIVDCPEIQKLRGIKQLGTTYLIYPGALHTRFEHSLGTSFLAKKIIQNVRKNGFPITSETEEIISIAGIVHDITHLPYGHTFEDERKIFKKHDRNEIFEKVLSNGTINDLLNNLGYKDQILKILTYKDLTLKSREDIWLNQIINDTICADLLDYLRRDCYFTGINKDYDDRVYSYFIVEDGKLVLNFAKNKMERSDARSEILHLLRLRYFLTERVYFHHAKLSSGAMISKAVELAVEDGLLSREELYRYNDWSLLHFLKNYPKKGEKEKTVKTLIERLEQRNLLKRAYILSSATLSSRKSRDDFINKFNPPTIERGQVEDMIIDRLRKITKVNTISKADVIIHCLSSSSLKEAEVLIKNKEGEIVQLNVRPHPTTEVKAIEDAYEDLWRFYVFANVKYAKLVGEICEETFGRDNEYSPNK